MIRLNMVVEGQTEESFANRVLMPHLSSLDIFPSVQLTAPKKKSSSREFKGGWNSYAAVKSHLMRWIKGDNSTNAYFTTMLDLYAIPRDFPGLERANEIQDRRERVEFLETSFRNDISGEGFDRFIPYLQLHEFEALIFSDPKYLDWEFLEHGPQIEKLIKIAGLFDSPEDINDGPQTAPSKRIIEEIPEYESRKVSAGPIVTEKIGILTLRSRCGHFDTWLKQLEALP